MENAANQVDNSYLTLKLVSQPQIEERSYGIDALRCLAMFLVVLGHLVGQGGVLDACVDKSLNYYVAWIIRIIAYPAVDVFAIITGYLMINRKWKISRIIHLWLEVVFYAITSTLIAKLIWPEEISFANILTCFIPVLAKMNWYFNAYFGLYFLMPFINKLLNVLNKRQTIIMLIMSTLLFSVLDTFSNEDIFQLNKGYSMIWLAIMYVVGASIKKYDFGKDVKNYWNIIAFFISFLLVFLSRIIIGILTNLILGEEKFTGILIGYTSPLILLMAISIFIYFKNIKISTAIGKLFSLISPYIFAVLIVHQNIVIKPHFIVGKFGFLASENVFIMVGVLLGVSLLIFIGAIVIEFLRTLLFKALKITHKINKFGLYMDGKINLGE